MLLPNLLKDNLFLLLNKLVQNSRVFQIVTGELDIGHLELGLDQVVGEDWAIARTLLLQNGFAVLPKVHSHNILVTIEKLVWWQIFEHDREVGHLNRVSFEFFDELYLLFLESIVKYNVQNDDKDVDGDDEHGELILGHCPLVVILIIVTNADVDLVGSALGHQNHGLHFCFILMHV